MLYRLSKKDNILIFNRWNITKLTNAVFPEYHWVILVMVYAFHRVNVSPVLGVYRPPCQDLGPIFSLVEQPLHLLGCQQLPALLRKYQQVENIVLQFCSRASTFLVNRSAVIKCSTALGDSKTGTRAQSNLNQEFPVLV